MEELQIAHIAYVLITWNDLISINALYFSNLRSIISIRHENVPQKYDHRSETVIKTPARAAAFPTLTTVPARRKKSELSAKKLVTDAKIQLVLTSSLSAVTAFLRQSQEDFELNASSTFSLSLLHTLLFSIFLSVPSLHLREESHLPVLSPTFLTYSDAAILLRSH